MSAKPAPVDAPITLTLPRFEPLSLDLGRRAIFVGPNGAGKTHLLYALARHYGVSLVRRGDFVHPPRDEAAVEAVEAACGVILPDPRVPPGVPVAAPFVREIMRAAYSRPVVLVDDLGEGLHIGAQARLAKALKDAQEARPELRVIYSTHSPYAFVDDEPASNVFIVARDPRTPGPDETPAKLLTRVKRLSQYPYPRWVGMLRAADLWASSGEDWIWDHHDEGGE